MAGLAALLSRRSQIAARQTSQVVTMPAPVGGWNRRDPLPQMAPEDAVTLDNMIPGIGAVSMRKGYSSHATGLGSYVESVMEYASISGTFKLFAAVPTAIYNVTASGAVGAADISSLSNGRWQDCMFATSAGNFMVIANGADSVRNYDGSSWSTPSITGVTSSTLIGVTPHVSRLWFVQKDTLDAWYLAVSSISGAATKFSIGAYCKRGGYLLAIGSWSRDGGAGADDLLVFITSEGEVVIYSGTDPDSASTFTQVGVFQIAKPIGRRCLVKAGADLGVLTAVGLIPLSRVLEINASGQGLTAITNKISGAFTGMYATAGSSFGWQVLEFAREKLVIVNVPFTERTTQHQYVVNVETGAWCRFTNLNAGCWGIMNNTLYFGGNDGKVYKYGTDYRDGSTTISVAIQTAFSDFGTNTTKRFVGARPLFRGPDGYTPSVEIKVDYDISPATLPATTSAASGSLWDVALWDAATWDGTSSPHGSWQGVHGLGQVGSISSTSSLSQEFVLNQVDVMFEPGGYL